MQTRIATLALRGKEEAPTIRVHCTSSPEEVPTTCNTKNTKGLEGDMGSECSGFSVCLQGCSDVDMPEKRNGTPENSKQRRKQYIKLWATRNSSAFKN